MKNSKTKNLLLVLLGIIIGTILTVVITYIAMYMNSNSVSVGNTLTSGVEPVVSSDDTSTKSSETSENETSTNFSSTTDTSTTNSASNQWDKNKTYNNGETVSYNGKMYKVRWWSKGEEPGSTAGGAWEDLMITDDNSKTPTTPNGVENQPIDATDPKSSEIKDFKVVGYYPSWKPDSLSTVDFNVLTHVIYSFAIPTSNGELMPLDNPQTAKALIDSAHKNNAKALLAIGGWSYNGTPLEPAFNSATDSPEKIAKFGDAIINMCNEYGFDGIDMDWEHPRVDGASAKQYLDLMLYLSERLHADNKLLTSAVLSGVTADGNVYYDSAAHSNAVLNAVDWINVMAYDGGDGDRHSSYDFAVNCGKYWHDTRGLPAHKVVLGVPFYARPSWAPYGDILKTVPDADQHDFVNFNGVEAHYNGVKTIEKKTKYAKENFGGIMIWELSQDTTDKDKSLLQAIGRAKK